MSKVVFSGHGGFETTTDPSWVTVPSGTTLYFYSDNMKALLDSNGQSVETMSAALDSATPSQVVPAGRQCPNYTLYPPDGLDILDAPDDVDQVIVNAPRTLDSLLDEWAGYDCYWAACRVVDLDEVGGQYLGVNAGQYELGGSDSAGDDDQWMANWLRQFATASEDDRIDMWNELTSAQKNGARLVDESVRQWYVAHTPEGSGEINEDEWAGFVQWWATAGEAERNQAWADLTAAQQEQLRARLQS